MQSYCPYCLTAKGVLGGKGVSSSTQVRRVYSVGLCSSSGSLAQADVKENRRSSLI